MESVYEVVVGNIGTVISTSQRHEAMAKYVSYIESSKAPFGRASGEDVTIFQDGDIFKEYIGSRSLAESAESDE